MQQLHHSNFGWQTSILKPSVMPLNGFTHPSSPASYSQQLRTISEEVLFGHFMTTLNNAFERELTLEDEGYESGSESLNISTPLHIMPFLYHI